MVIEELGTRLLALLLRQEPTLPLYIGEDWSMVNIFVVVSVINVIRGSPGAPEIARKVATEFGVKAQVRLDAKHSSRQTKHSDLSYYLRRSNAMFLIRRL